MLPYMREKKEKATARSRALAVSAGVGRKVPRGEKKKRKGNTISIWLSNPREEGSSARYSLGVPRRAPGRKRVKREGKKKGSPSTHQYPKRKEDRDRTSISLSLRAGLNSRKKGEKGKWASPITKRDVSFKQKRRSKTGETLRGEGRTLFD